jgi:hypothetical protein
MAARNFRQLKPMFNGITSLTKVKINDGYMVLRAALPLVFQSYKNVK